MTEPAYGRELQYLTKGMVALVRAGLGFNVGIHQLIPSTIHPRMDPATTGKELPAGAERQGPETAPKQPPIVSLRYLYTRTLRGDEEMHLEILLLPNDSTVG